MTFDYNMKFQIKEHMNMTAYLEKSLYETTRRTNKN